MRACFAVLCMVLVVAGCGGDDDQGAPATASGGTEPASTTEAGVATTMPPGDTPSGRGSAQLTIGDETWVFESVVCAFGEDQIGQEGAEFVLSSIEGGLQLYATIDSFGHNVSIDDIANFQNPSVGWDASRSFLSLIGRPTEFVEVSGSEVSAVTLFRNTAAEEDDFEGTPGMLTAVCP